jgi:tryptophanyl-tRNA synthetase
VRRVSPHSCGTFSAMATHQPLVFSGMQPSGDAPPSATTSAPWCNWVAAAGDPPTAIYCVVDLHAITVWQDPEGAARRQIARGGGRAISPAGMDPQRCYPVRAVARCARTRGAGLGVQLRGAAGLAEPHDAVQGQGRQGPGERRRSGCLAYPSLMAADILDLPGHPGAGGRRPEAAPGTGPRHRAESSTTTMPRASPSSAMATHSNP